QYASFLDDPANFVRGMQNVRGIARIDTAIWNQGGSIYQGGAELVANAIDAVLIEKGAPPIGRFGVGFFMILAVLAVMDSPEGRIHLRTSSEKGRARFVSYRRNPLDGQYEVNWGPDAQGMEKGTSVEATFPFASQADKDRVQDYLKELEAYLRKRFSQNRYLKIYLHFPDGREELLNPLEGVTDLQGKPLSHRYDDARMDIDFLEDGFRVRDQGTGIDDNTIMEQLLVPRSPHKHMPSGIKEDFHMFWVPNDNPSRERQPARIGIVINGQGVMDFNAEGRSLPRQLFIELPPSSWLPESRNKVRLSVEEVTALVNQVLQSPVSPESKAQILNALALVLKRIQEEISVDLLQQALNQLRPWMESLERAGYVILPNEPGFYAIATGDKAPVYLDATFFDFLPEKMPSAERVEDYESRDHTLYLVDIKDPSLISFDHGNAIFLNRAHYLPHKEVPAPPDLWLEAVQTHYRDHAVVRRGRLRPPRPERRQDPSVSELAKEFPFINELSKQDQMRVLQFLRNQSREWQERWLRRAAELFNALVSTGRIVKAEELISAILIPLKRKAKPSGLTKVVSLSALADYELQSDMVVIAGTPYFTARRTVRQALKAGRPEMMITIMNPNPVELFTVKNGSAEQVPLGLLKTPRWLTKRQEKLYFVAENDTGQSSLYTIENGDIRHLNTAHSGMPRRLSADENYIYYIVGEQSGKQDKQLLF
ncbi:MAG TPA: hypothetical protein VD913_03435, partial [bacterium]|nr:hypothetical protein [bacterium]